MKIRSLPFGGNVYILSSLVLTFQHGDVLADLGAVLIQEDSTLIP